MLTLAFRQDSVIPTSGGMKCGNTVLLPVAGLQEWLREQSEVEKGRTEKAVTEILEAIHPKKKD